MDYSLNLEPLHFVVSPLGLWKTWHGENISIKKCNVIICCIASPHHAPTKWQVFCRNVYSMNWRVVVHLLAERSQQLLLVKLFSSVLCPYKMTGPLPTYYKMGCFLLLPTHYSPTMPPQSERSSSHIPHHRKSCPYKMRGFLPNTYNRGWHCCSIFLSFSQAYNLRLWTVQNSSGFWHPSMVPSKKKCRRTHTHRTTKFQVGFLLPFGFTTKWVPWICYIQTVLDVSKCSTPFKANFLSTKWVLYNGWKQHPKTSLIKKK